ncbi:MAG: rhamnosyltransferase [Frankiales bacterium]|nr:rhamnosyltransferase [Frankiales bacterium]
MNDVIALIVSYNCSELIERSVLAAIDQVARIYVVDNGSDADTRAALARLRDAYGPDRLHITLLDRNVGIAEGLNVALESARVSEWSYALTLDHDTEIASGAVGLLTECMSDEGVGIAAAQWVTSVRDSHNLAAEDVEKAPFAGCLIRRSVLDQVGGMREDYFVDYVDYEFCIRVRKAGWRIRTCPAATVFQRPGEPRQRRFLWRTVVISGYSADRYYSIARNGLWLFLWDSPDALNLLAHARNLFLISTKALLYGPHRRETLAALCRGLIHGVFRSKRGVRAPLG